MMLKTCKFLILLCTILKFFIPTIIMRKSWFKIAVDLSSFKDTTVVFCKTLRSRGQYFGLILWVMFVIGVREWTDCWYCWWWNLVVLKFWGEIILDLVILISFSKGLVGTHLTLLSRAPDLIYYQHLWCFGSTSLIFI